MYFDDFKQHQQAVLNPKLLWEYKLDNFDFERMRNVVVQRVVERAWPDDWYFMLNLYGVDGVKAAIKSLTYLNDKDMCFVSHQFNIPIYRRPDRSLHR